jgi:hypothetical protein
MTETFPMQFGFERDGLRYAFLGADGGDGIVIDGHGLGDRASRLASDLVAESRQPAGIFVPRQQYAVLEHHGDIEDEGWVIGLRSVPREGWSRVTVVEPSVRRATRRAALS